MKHNWKMKKLGEVCDIIAGQSPEGKYYNDKGEGLPFYQGKKEFTEKYIGEPTTWTTKITKEAYKDDVLMSVRAPVGPVNFATEKICIGRGLAAIRSSNKIDKEFLYNFLVKHENEIIGNKGAVFDSINKSQIENIKVPFPPLPEQKRIVTILDEAFVSIAKAKENTEKNHANTKEVFESYLNEVFANPGDDWVEKKLKEITTKIGSGATPLGGEKSYKINGISLIRSLNVHDYNFKLKDLAFIDDKQSDLLSNVIVESEDVLLNITGASIARCCIVPDNVLPARVNQHVSIIRLMKNIILPEYLHYFLISKVIKDKLLLTGEKNGATRQALTKALIENFKVYYPSLKKQKSIVKKLDELSLEIKQLEKIYRYKINNLEELKKSILNKAFIGEL